MKVLQLLGNRVQVKPLPQDDKAGEHVLYAPGHKPEQNFHEVIAVGTGQKLKNGTVVALPVKVGDTVLLDQYALQSKTDSGDGTWIVSMEACSLVVQPLMGMVEDT